MVAYSFYRDTYGGVSLSQQEWELFGRRAYEQLERYKRCFTVTPSDTGEAMAICAMADTLAYFSAAQNGSGGAISSAAIGSVSVHYDSAGSVDISPDARERELLRCATLYLDIYRGVGTC